VLLSFDKLSHCDRLLTAKELAGMLAIIPKTKYSYVERNMIPYHQIEANVRFRASDIVRSVDALADADRSEIIFPVASHAPRVWFRPGEFPR
jgi:hypothetical protein